MTFHLDGEDLYFDNRLYAKVIADVRRDGGWVWTAEDFILGGDSYPNLDVIETEQERLDDQIKLIKAEIERVQEFLPDIDQSTLMGICAETNIFTALMNLRVVLVQLETISKHIYGEIYDTSA